MIESRRLAPGLWAASIAFAAVLSAAGGDADIGIAAPVPIRVQRPVETTRHTADWLDGSTDPAGRYAESSTDEASTPPEERSPEDLVAQSLNAATAVDRAAAIDALAYALPGDSGKESYVTWVLTQALTDPDQQVRGQALATLKDTADELPLAAVAQVARDDPDPGLRVQALELLVERTGEQAREPLRLALADPEPAVRDRSAELIADWHLSVEDD